MHSQAGSGGGFPSSSGSSSYSRSQTDYYHDSRWNTRYGGNAPGNAAAPSRGNSDTAFCIFTTVAVLFGSLWFFQDSSERAEMGLNYSRVVKPSGFYYRKMQVSGETEVPGPVLYTFSSKPELTESKEWSYTYEAPLHGQSHHEWALWLNKGSNMDIEYETGADDFGLVVAVLRGMENFKKWRAAPLDSGSAMYWRSVHGTGKVHIDVPADDDYYFAFGNTGFSSMKPKIQLKANITLYRHDGAASTCVVGSRSCDVHLSPFWTTYVLLAATNAIKGADDVWYVNISYRAQWLSPVLLFGTVIAVVAWIVYERRGKRQDEKESLESKSLMEEGSDSQVARDENEQSTCCVCLDAAKDCFFDPCGHSATCYSCGQRIKEAKNQCPICRREISEVRKLYNA